MPYVNKDIVQHAHNWWLVTPRHQAITRTNVDSSWRCLWNSLDDNFVRNQSVTWVRGVCVEITINPGLHWVKYFLKEHPLDKILLAPGYNVSSQWNNSILLCIQDTFTNVCQLPVCRAWTNAFNIAYEKLNSNDVHHRYHFNRFPAF